MTKEEYQKLLSEKNEAIRNIRNEIAVLERQYCKECSPFQVGDRVRFGGKEGIIDRIKPYYDKFEYWWRPFRKDGTEGCQQHIYGFNFDEIEKV